jgi:hypothetical protein
MDPTHLIMEVNGVTILEKWEETYGPDHVYRIIKCQGENGFFQIYMKETGIIQKVYWKLTPELPWTVIVHRGVWGRNIPEIPEFDNDVWHFDDCNRRYDDWGDEHGY